MNPSRTIPRHVNTIKVINLISNARNQLITNPSDPKVVYKGIEMLQVALIEIARSCNHLSVFSPVPGVRMCNDCGEIFSRTVVIP